MTGSPRGETPEVSDDSSGPDDPDHVSLTSSADREYDSDEQFQVDGMLAERTLENGTTQLLVKWHKFGLHDCTWEPVSELGPVLSAQWEEIKAKEQRGEREPFDVQVFEDAKIQWQEGWRDRHRLRNALRKERGLPQTEPFSDESSDELDSPGAKPRKAGTPSSEEAVEDAAAVEDTAAEIRPTKGTVAKEKPSGDRPAEEGPAEEGPAEDKPAKQRPAEDKPAKQRPVGDKPAKDRTAKDKTAKGTIAKDTTAEAIRSKPQKAKQPRPTTTLVPQQRLFTGVALPSKPQSESVPTVPRRPSSATTPTSASAPPLQKLSRQAPAPSTSTGYQGTARKSGSTLSSGPTRPSVTLPGGSSSTAAGRPAVARPDGEAALAGKPLTAGSSRITARRTGTLAQAKRTVPIAGNVFTSGKIRKKRTRLEDVAADPTKASKHFSNLRLNRLAEVRSQNRENAAPNPSVLSSSLFEISRGPQHGQRKASMENREARQDGNAEIQPVYIDLDSEEAQQPVAAATAPGKKRKSVRFGGQYPIVLDASVNIDPSPKTASPTTIEGPQRLLPPPPQPSVPWNLSVASQKAKALQNVNKAVLFGAQAPPVDVIFNGIPRGSDATWLTAFLAQQSLLFTHACLVRSLPNQLGVFRKENLCSGTITGSAAAEGAIAAVANHLRFNLTGLFCATTEYSVMVFPTKCEEWKALDLSSDPSSPADVALLFAIFSTKFDCVPRLIPPRDPAAAAIQKASAVPAATTDRVLIMRQSFGLEYERLLSTPGSRGAVQYHFFLAFPQARLQTTLRSLSTWLRECNPQCRIYISHQAGAWADFRRRILAKGTHDIGVAIIHESIVFPIRRFPGLLDLVHSYRCHFWSLSESLRAHSIFPSLSAWDCVSPAGEIRVVRLFPYRNAILVTPSFLVSEPRKAQELFDWFKSFWAEKSDYKLVTAWKIPDFLRDLAEEKQEERRSWQEQSRADIVRFEIDAAMSALSKADCAARFKTWMIASDLADLREERGGPLASDEENSPLIYADEAIDPNDEQSLVNWFGLWSLMRLDQFKKFHVVGTSEEMKRKGAGARQRDIRPPKYSDLSINDPDSVMEAVEQHQSTEAGESDAPLLSNQQPPGADPGTGRLEPVTRGAPVGPRETPSWRFESERFATDTPRELFNYLVLRSNRKAVPCVLFNRPVSDEDRPMPYRSGAMRDDYYSIPEWWEFQRKWRIPLPPFQKVTNSYMGFFYSRAGESSNAARIPAGLRRRHAWVVVYRLVNASLRNRGQYELVIWDSDAPRRCPGDQQPTEEDLLPVQRQLVEYVREHVSEEGDNSRLQRVWLGGFLPVRQGGSTHNIDQAADFLDAITDSMESIRHYLPAPDHYMPERGFRLVQRRPKDRRLSSTASHGSFDSGAARDHLPTGAQVVEDTADQDRSGEEGADTRVIFHPPRGKTYKTDQRSECTNNLYEQARLWRLRDSNAAATMRYEFKPTLEWYEQQRAEGRGFEHINVANWKNFFESINLTPRSENGVNRHDSAKISDPRD